MNPFILAAALVASSLAHPFNMEFPPYSALSDKNPASEVQSTSIEDISQNFWGMQRKIPNLVLSNKSLNCTVTLISSKPLDMDVVLDGQVIFYMEVNSSQGMVTVYNNKNIPYLKVTPNGLTVYENSQETPLPATLVRNAHDIKRLSYINLVTLHEMEKIFSAWNAGCHESLARAIEREPKTDPAATKNSNQLIAKLQGFLSNIRSVVDEALSAFILPPPKLRYKGPRLIVIPPWLK